MKLAVSHWTMVAVAALAGITALRMMQPAQSADAASVPAAPGVSVSVGNDTSVPSASSIKFDEAAQGDAQAPTF